MKKKPSITNLTYFILPFLLLIFPALLQAQPGFTDDTSDVPVDGGLTLLVAAGIGYGVKKIKGKRNQNL